MVFVAERLIPLKLEVETVPLSAVRIISVNGTEPLRTQMVHVQSSSFRQETGGEGALKYFVIGTSLFSNYLLYFQDTTLRTIIVF